MSSIGQWHTAGEAQVPLRDRLTHLMGKASTPSSSGLVFSHNLLQSYPAFRVLPLAALDRLCCERCRGDGGYSSARGEETCVPCLGTGLVCPSCRGLGKVHTCAKPGAPYTLFPCPDCRSAVEIGTGKDRQIVYELNKEKRANTIYNFVRAQLEEQQAA